MKKILVLNASPNGDQSVSRKLTEKITSELKVKYGALEIISHDLDANPPPYWTGANVQAAFTPIESRTAEMNQSLTLSDKYAAELLDADIVVIGSPMWNFNMPAVLKSWVDHISRPGVTFSHGVGGLKSLVANKKVFLAVSSGSVFSHGPYKEMDHLVPHLQVVLGFIGVADVTVIRAEGTNDPKASAHALEAAESQVRASF